MTNEFAQSAKAQGVLTVVIVEGRNLNNGDGDINPLCVVEFDQHQINTPASNGCKYVCCLRCWRCYFVSAYSSYISGYTMTSTHSLTHLLTVRDGAQS